MRGNRQASSSQKRRRSRFIAQEARDGTEFLASLGMTGFEIVHKIRRYELGGSGLMRTVIQC